jgi:hypothetical protein
MTNLKIAENRGAARRIAEQRGETRNNEFISYGKFFSSILLIFNNTYRIDLIVMRNLKIAENRGEARSSAENRGAARRKKIENLVRNEEILLNS